MHFPSAPRGATRTLAAAVIAAAVLAAAAPAARASSHSFTTTGGVVVDFDPVPGLSCDGLRRKLAEIDRSGYRGSRPVPLYVEDEPLFIYENKVSRAFYSNCARPAGEDDASRALRNGGWGRENRSQPIGASR